MHGQLLGQIDLAHAAFADASDQFVAADLFVDQHAAFALGAFVANNAAQRLGQALSGGSVDGAFSDQDVSQRLFDFAHPIHGDVELVGSNQTTFNG